MTITQGYLEHPVFPLIRETARELGVRAFVIGGYVRDCFLGRPNTDIDIVVESTPELGHAGIALAQALGAKCHARVSVFKNFGTAMLRYKGVEVEFVGARKESYQRESRKPIVEDGTLAEDQLRRDFTINAMAFSLQEEDFGALVDPFGGIRDLSAGIIRTPLDPEQTYSDDPLRMLRAIRFAAQLGTPEHPFRIVPESLRAMRTMAERLGILSRERIVEELNKMLMSPHPAQAFHTLEETGLLERFLPELSRLKGVETVDGKGHKENFSHTLQVVENVIAFEREAIAWAVKAVDAAEIDRINILNASIEGMKRSLDALPVKPGLVLVDGNRFSAWRDVPAHTVVKGDATVQAIAAASVLAKTHRDEYMRKIAQEYPQYGWDRNMAYPTEEHRAAIRRYGITPYHRRSYNLLGEGNDLLF